MSPDQQPILHSLKFAALCEMLLVQGFPVRFSASGQSMKPNVLDGDLVEIKPVLFETLQTGDIALTRNGDAFRLHRIIRCDAQTKTVFTRGDAGHADDPAPATVLGKAVALERSGNRISFARRGTTSLHLLRKQAHRVKRAAAIRATRLRAAAGPLIFAFFALLSFAAPAMGQAFTVTNTPIAATIGPGQPLTFTQVVSNNSGRTINEPETVTQNIPAGTTFENINYANATGTTATWTCTNTATTVTCKDTTSFKTAYSTTFTAIFAVSASASIGSSISDTVNAQGANAGQVGATGTVTVQTADLSMTQTVSALAVAVGSTITYTESVTNNGPSAAVGATLYQQTPPNTTFVSMTPPTGSGWTCPTVPGSGGTGQVICTAGGNMNANTTVGNFVFVVTVATGTAAGTTIINTADVTSQTDDPVSSNNATSTSTLVEVAADADLSISMSASPTPVFVSSSLTYTIQVQNLGLAAAAGVTVVDTLPASLANASATSTGATCNPPSGGTITCTIAAMTYPASAVTIAVTGTTPGTATTLTNSATVSETPSTADPVSTNNTATVLTVVQPLVCATPGKDGAGGTLTGIVNAYYPPASTVGTVNAGSTSVALGAAATGGAQTAIASGDLLLIIQMQGAQINSTDNSSYGSGVAGQSAGYTSLGSSGLFEFVTATSAVPVAGGTLNFIGTGAGSGLLNTYVSAAASSTQGIQTFQVIRVPQYTSATFSSGLTALAWNGATGGVLALDIASQLTLGGTVAVDGLGFRGGGGIDLDGSTTGTNADTVTTSPATLPATPPGTGANASKGEGIAGTPHWVAPALSTITTSSTAVSTNQTYVEGYPSGSFARGAPANAGGGATDAHPSANDQNSGGGGGGNGGNGGVGGFGWSSAGVVGGFGGVAVPPSTSLLVMGGGGGAGTNNNGAWWNPTNDTGNNGCGTTCTGVYSSGTAGAGIVIVHAGSVTGTGTISASGQAALDLENDAGGGGGAGGTILVFADSGTLTGLTANALGGIGGNPWVEQAPGTTFPGNRHGPGGGGGGGAVLATSTPGGSAMGGSPGTTTLAQDAYGATAGQPGVTITGLTITETPGTQSGAYCASADLAVTNSGTPNPVVPGNDITYTQTVSNSGPFDAVNATFTEAVPANTTFVSFTPSGADASGWNCTTPGPGGTGNITCTNPDIPAGAAGATTFTFLVQVNAGTAQGTQIVDTDSITSGTNDPNLANNNATVLTIVAAANSANLAITNAATPNPVLAGNNITYTVVVTNNGPSVASTVVFSENIPANTSLVSVNQTGGTGGWSCTSGVISCSISSLAVGASTTFTVVVKVNSATTAGTIITDTANVSSATTNPNPTNTSATVNVVVATGTQADLAVTIVGTPNPVLAGNKLIYTVVVTNNGPTPNTVAHPVLTDTFSPYETVTTTTPYPTGWTCNAPSGSSFTCNGPASMAANTSAIFTFVMTVTPGTAPATAVTNGVSVGPTANDPNLSNNIALVTSDVASPTQADVAIIKTASPEPVDQGTNLTYTLQVTNNGPAVAQGVVVADPLPTEVTYNSYSTTQGSCTYTSAITTVTCNLGSISVGGLAIVTINTTAATFSSDQLATNTAAVTATTADPNLTNNTSTATSTIQSATAVQIVSLNAFALPNGGVAIEWRTREEVHNLGFHIYRDDAQGRHRVDPSLVAGSALLLRGGMPQHRAKTYQWLDARGTASATYWIEDVDVNGTRAMHGPIYVEPSNGSPAPLAQARLLTNLNQSIAAQPVNTVRVLTSPPMPIPVVSTGEPVASLNGMPAVKISVTNEGWYQVSKSQLVAAGLDPDADSRMLQLYAEGIEQPILVLGNQNGPLGPNDSIEFYGTGIDTPFSGTRVYWLVRGSKPGKRISSTNSGSSASATASSFPYTVLFQQRTTYFAALLNGENNDNFFGAIVTSEPVDQTFNVTHIDRSSSLPVTMDVTLQGVTDGQTHAVSVSLNGAPVGEIDFSNQANVTNTLLVNASLLVEGTNTVTLTALDGDNDVSLVQSIAVNYPHTYTVDSNWLRAAATTGDVVRISGFTNSQIYVADITDPTAITQLAGPVTFDGSTFGITLAIRGASGASHTLLAFSNDQISAPEGLAFHKPNSIDKPQFGAHMIVISNPEFVTSVQPLVRLHESQGTSVAVVTTDQIFDAFNFGERSPFAMRSYLQLAATTWHVHPQSILLVGRASFDPRDYLGFGYLDFVPTRIIETAAFKTASDDWFTDFNETGYATIPTGRLPVDTPTDASLVVSKIVGYESGASAGAWQQQALVVADQNVGVDFTTEAQFAAADMPKSLSVTQILADGEDQAIAQQQILAALNAGALIVNYTGHGSEAQWSFEDLLDDSTIATLSNGERLPVYLLMDCLNGFFHDVYETSLSTSLMLAPNGGAVAVWASSGFTDAAPQGTMNQALLGILAANPSTPLGSAILSAKTGVTDSDVRRTWILFGDPAMRLPISSHGSSQTKR